MIQYVVIDVHALCGDSFAFFKKQSMSGEAPFIVHFSQDKMYSNLTPSTTAPETSVQPVTSTSNEPKHFQWATCKKTGRPHARDLWELNVEMGERLKVLQDMGRGWYLAVGRKGVKGWVHQDWLDFGDYKLHANPQSAYVRFEDDLKKMLVPGQLAELPSMASYICSCTKAVCQQLKEESDLGICAHDLLLLLQGCSSYSREWLKEKRNIWHPDRFARFCNAEHVERLKAMAQQMFVLYGILMESA